MKRYNLIYTDGVEKQKIIGAYDVEIDAIMAGWKNYYKNDGRGFYYVFDAIEIGYKTLEEASAPRGRVFAYISRRKCGLRRCLNKDCYYCPFVSCRTGYDFNAGGGVRVWYYKDALPFAEKYIEEHGGKIIARGVDNGY